LLCHLARQAGRPVSKAELFMAIWPGISVTDDSLVQCVRDIRRVLRDRHRRIVKTVPRVGYLFAGLIRVIRRLHPMSHARRHRLYLCLREIVRWSRWRVSPI
jgi:DNA-binding winged helix-turn-helix (wHTH) protein